MTNVLGPDNRLLALARQGGRPPSALVAIAVVFAILVLALIPGQILSSWPAWSGITKTTKRDRQPRMANSDLLPQKADHLVGLHHAHHASLGIDDRQRPQVVFVEHFRKIVLAQIGGA